jgi:CRP/FNR family transcriptional regulator, nitrogen oxide reductase regulator
MAYTISDSISPPNTIAACLASFPVFKGLVPSELEDLAKYCVMEILPPGQALFRQGEAAEYVFFISDGKVKLSQRHTNGRDVTFHVFGKGDLVGDVSALKRNPYSMSAFTLTESVLLKTRWDDFIHRFLRFPCVSAGALLQMGDFLYQAYRSKMSAADPVEVRIAQMLLSMLKRPGMALDEPGGGVRINMPLTRRDVAEMVGTTVETAIRIIRKWTKAKVVIPKRRFLVVLNEAELKKYSAGASKASSD